MGFGCFRSGDDKNTVLRSCQIESDSLVNNQILREIDEGICNASFTIEPRAQSLDFMIMATKNYLHLVVLWDLIALEPVAIRITYYVRIRLKAIL